MGIVWLLIALSSSALTYVFVSESSDYPIWISCLYAWIPGGLGLLWFYLKDIRIPLLPISWKYSSICLSGGFAIGALSFFISSFFSGSGSIATLSNAIFYIFSYYFLFLILFFFLFIGGEFCWRGYLWGKWKDSPLKGNVIIWLLWSLWLAPEALASSKNLAVMAFLNLSLIPFLHFFRLKSRSIVPGTCFYASIFASNVYFQMLFSTPQNYPALYLAQGSILIVVAVVSALFLKPSLKRF